MEHIRQDIQRLTTHIAIPESAVPPVGPSLDEICEAVLPMLRSAIRTDVARPAVESASQDLREHMQASHAHLLNILKPKLELTAQTAATMHAWLERWAALDDG